MTLLDRIHAWDQRALASRRLMAVESLALFLFFGVLHWLIFRDVPRWTDADAPYHHLLQAEIHAGGWWRDVTWLPHTVLGPAGTDHHWLWHLLLSPFSAIDDLTTRINVVNAFSFALIPAFTNLALRLIGIRFAPVWILVLMAGTNWIMFRWSMARAQNPACVLMILFIAALARRHKPSLLLLPFVFMHTYHGAAILAVPGIAYFGFRWLREKTPDWSLLLLPAIGGALALVTSPWYPHNIEYFLFHALDKVGNDLQLDIGREWGPAPYLQMMIGLSSYLAALLIALVGGAALLRRRLSPLTLMALLTTVVFLLLAHRNARFVEYCPQIMVLAAALVIRDCHERFTGRIRPAVIALVAAAALLMATSSLLQVREFRYDTAANSFQFGRQIATVLNHYAKPGALVVNTRWDAFPALAWHAPGLRYLSGLDPYYLAYGDPERFIALERLRGRFIDPKRSDVDIGTDFGSEWVVTDKQRIAQYLAGTGEASVVMFDRAHMFLVYVGDDPVVAERLVTEGRQWLHLVWHRHETQGGSSSP